MYKINNEPVKTYRSTDKDAPQLSDAKGAIATIYKACLVTGYGDTQPAGWQISFEDIDANKLMLQSTNPTIQNYHFIINDSFEYEARVGICVNPADINAANIAYGKRYGDNEQGAARITRNVGKWVVIANDVFCWLFCADPDSDRYSWYFFGALHPMTAESEIIVAAIGAKYSDEITYDNGPFSFGSTNRSVVLTNKQNVYQLKSLINIDERSYTSTDFNLSKEQQEHLIWADIIFWDGANPVGILPVIKYVNYKKDLKSFDEIEPNVYGFNTAGYNSEAWLLVAEVTR